MRISSPSNTSKKWRGTLRVTTSERRNAKQTTTASLQYSALVMMNRDVLQEKVITLISPIYHATPHYHHATKYHFPDFNEMEKWEIKRHFTG